MTRIMLTVRVIARDMTIPSEPGPERTMTVSDDDPERIADALSAWTRTAVGFLTRGDPGDDDADEDAEGPS